MISSPLIISGPPRCRIWLSELPDTCQSVGGKRKELILPVTDSSVRLASAAQVAIEVFKPAGPRFYFGMLGGSFKPDTDVGGLHVIIECSTDDTSLVSDSLAGSLDKVHSGIPEWVADAILQTAKEVVEGQQRLRGTVTLSCGAFGEASSSTVVFSYLTRVLFTLLDHATRSSLLGQDEIAHIVSEHRL